MIIATHLCDDECGDTAHPRDGRLAFVTSDGRSVEARTTSRGYFGENDWDLFEVTEGGETQLTVADPWSHQPTGDEVISFLTPRKQALVRLFADRKIVAGDDYQYAEDYELLETPGEIGRFVAVYGDETYHQVHVVGTVRQALDSLSGIVGEEYCGLPEGVHDLDTGKLHSVVASVSLAPESAAELDVQRPQVGRTITARDLSALPTDVREVAEYALSSSGEGFDRVTAAVRMLQHGISRAEVLAFFKVELGQGAGHAELFALQVDDALKSAQARDVDRTSPEAVAASAARAAAFDRMVAAEVAKSKGAAEN